ncbi:hypothetical protein JCM3774_003400 [Rhodotorula dairenensis]
MATLLDDLDPYGAAALTDNSESPRESTPGPNSPLRLLDLSFLAAVTPRSAERSALIDFSVSPPPPLYPSSQPSTQPDMAPVHLLDESFAVESPIRVFHDKSSETGAAGRRPRTEEEWERGATSAELHDEKENRPLPRPPRKRWSVMTKLRDEHQNAPRHSLSPIKDLSPLRAGDASVFLSPTQLGVVDLSLIADEGASFLAVADTSDTVSRLGHVRPRDQSRQDLAGNDSSLGSGAEGDGQSGGMSVLLRDLGDGNVEKDQVERDPALAQSSILPPALTSSHRRALQQSVAPSSRSLTDTTLLLDEPSRAEVSLLNCSTASFKDYRDSPRKARVLSTHAEDWSLEEEEEGDVLRESVNGRTPRPPRKTARVSDATSDGDSFRLDGFQTSGFDTGILNQSPPTGTLKPESTGTLRLELGLGELEAFASPPLKEASSSSPPTSPGTDLASSTRTVLAASSSRSSSRASTVLAEGDLLGDESALAPLRPASLVAADAKPMSGAERLKRRLEELRAQKQHGVSMGLDSTTVSSTARKPPLNGTAIAGTTASAFATPGRRSLSRPSILAPTPATGRLARPRLSTLPTATSGPSLSKGSVPPPATPGERKESTAARLERLRSERKERETIRGGGAGGATPGRAAGGLVRSASFVAPQSMRDRSVASSVAGTGTKDGARLPSSRSLADLSSYDKTPAPRTTTTSRRTSLLPAPAPTPGLGRRYLLTSSLLSGMLAVRLVAQRPFRQISILQFLALLLLAMSLLFVITLAIVILGKGAHPQQVAYEGVMWLRIFLYALSKLVLFLFLLEKVRSVHGLAVLGHRNHLDSKWYRIGALMVIGWVGVAVLLFPGRIVRLRNGTCYVGLKRFTSIPLLVVETITYSYLSLAFLFPIWRSKSLEVVRLGRRSSVAALVSLLTSVSNGIILTALHGEELSWICVISCSLDITIDAIVVHVVTPPAMRSSPCAASRPDTRQPGRTNRWRSVPKKHPGRLDLSTIRLQVTQEVQVDDEREPCFLFSFGILICLLSHRITALIARRALASSVHLVSVLLLTVSVSFVFISSLLVLGSSPGRALRVCKASIWLCLVLYSASKLLVYLVLLERLYIVHGNSATARGGRSRSPLYVIGAVLLVLWTGLIFLIVPWKSAQLRGKDGACVLSLRLWTLFPSLAMDCIANLYLSVVFIIPVARSRFSEAKRLARTSTIATLASLAVTVCNAIALSILHGKERMFVCLGACALDVTANAVIVYVVTTPRRDRDSTPSRVVSPVPRMTEGATYKPVVAPAAAASSRPPSWDWRRSCASARSAPRVDLGSISVQVHEEVAVDELTPAALHPRLPKPPDRIRAAGSTRSFVREAPAASSSSSAGSSPVSAAGLSEAESGSDGESKGRDPNRVNDGSC